MNVNTIQNHTHSKRGVNSESRGVCIRIILWCVSLSARRNLAILWLVGFISDVSETNRDEPHHCNSVASAIHVHTYDKQWSQQAFTYQLYVCLNNTAYRHSTDEQTPAHICLHNQWRAPVIVLHACAGNMLRACAVMQGSVLWRNMAQPTLGCTSEYACGVALQFWLRSFHFNAELACKSYRGLSV